MADPTTTAALELAHALTVEISVDQRPAGIYDGGVIITGPAGKSIRRAWMSDEQHLMLEMTDDSVLDAGEIKAGMSRAEVTAAIAAALAGYAGGDAVAALDARVDALESKPDPVTDLSAYYTAVQVDNRLGTKANASTVGGLSTQVDSIATRVTTSEGDITTLKGKTTLSDLYVGPGETPYKTSDGQWSSTGAVRFAPISLTSDVQGDTVYLISKSELQDPNKKKISSSASMLTLDLSPYAHKAELDSNIATVKKSINDNSGRIDVVASNVSVNTYNITQLQNLPQLPKPTSPTDNGKVVIANGLGYSLQSPTNDLPAGGTAGQVLAKSDNGDYHVQWISPSGGIKMEVFGSPTGSGTYTWTKPQGAKLVEVWVFGAGGGGGSGRRGAAGSNRYGGGGGSSGVINTVRYGADLIPATVSITVGSGGAGGAAVTTDSTSGNNGSSASTATSFGNMLMAYTGFGGNGGGTSSGSASAVMTQAMYPGSSGAVGSVASGSFASSTFASTGGSGGGGINSSNAAGTGGAAYPPVVYGGPPATPAGASGADHNPAAIRLHGTVGGTGGNASTTGDAQAGGNGGWPGAGGGGGGASVDGTGASGAGGRGGNGAVVVITYF